MSVEPRNDGGASAKADRAGGLCPEPVPVSAVPALIPSAFRAGSTVHVVNVSGGKDSGATLELAMERKAQRPEMQIVPLFADTENEHEFVYEQLVYLEERYGVPITRVRLDSTDAIMRRRERLPGQWAEAGVAQHYIDRAMELLWPTGNAYLDLCLAKGMFAAGIKRKFCTEELKIKPADEQVVKPLLEAGHRVIQWFGIRADESAKRADEERHPRLWRQSLVSFESSFTPAGRLVNIRPILDWTVDDIVAYHAARGLRMNPLYAHGFSRVGCFPCINERKGGMALITRHFPEHIERIRTWEQLLSEVNVSWRKAENFLDVATFFPAGVVPGLHRNSIDDVARWSTTARGGRQQDFLAGFVPDQKFYSCGGTGWCEAA
jgi:3'-phosphoadenosine 5'-phosphosulfate sulfotransferase (PAPS reductase)/FAD synthetase